MISTLKTMFKPQTDRIAAAFCNRTLPKAEWTHEAHLRVGLWHLLHYDPTEAMRRLREGIRQYNTVCGVANTDTSGYHETITQFYVVIIAYFLKGQDSIRPIDQLAVDLIKTYGDRHLLFVYYSQERLMSQIARRQWIEPDLVPLPKDNPGSMA